MSPNQPVSRNRLALMLGRQRKPSFDRALSEFRPGVLAVQDAPPSPAARRLAWLIMTLFFTGFWWAILGTLDIVAIAHGRVIPSGHSKPVHALAAGEVSAIHVRDAQRVKRHALLVELDATVELAEEGRLVIDHRDALHSRDRLQKLLSLLQTERVPELEQAARELASGPDSQATQSRLLRGQLLALAKRLQVLDRNLLRQQETLRSAQAEIRKLELVLPLVSERAHGIKSLVDQKLQGRHAWFDAEKERIVHAQNLELQRLRQAEINAAISQLQSERESLLADQRREFLEQQWQNEQKIKTLGQELVKVRELINRRQVRAPAAGVVQQLSVHASGAAVATGATLMVIVPETRKLEIDATLLNRDIGFVRAGQTAEIKVETFPFTRYGTVPARVVNVSRDAVIDDQLGLVYSVKLALLQGGIRVDGESGTLSPGMGVVAEINTGERRIIDYLLSPLLRYRQEAMRER